MIRRAARPDIGYTTLSNEPPNDPGLSWGAKGMLWYLLCKPDDWEAKMSILFEASSDGEHATRSDFKELEQAGYIQRTKGFDDQTGRVVWDYVVFDTPQVRPPTQPAREKKPKAEPSAAQESSVATPLAPRKRTGGVYDFSQGLPEAVTQFLIVHNCPWHWEEDLAKFCFNREMGDPTAYMLGVLKRWLLRGDGTPPARERTTTTKSEDVYAERRKKMFQLPTN